MARSSWSPLPMQVRRVRHMQSPRWSDCRTHWRRPPTQSLPVGLCKEIPTPRTALASRVLLVCHSLGGTGLRRTLLTPVPPGGRRNGSRVSQIPRLVFPCGFRPFDHSWDSVCQSEKVPSSNNSMCGSDVGRFTPMVALPTSMNTTRARQFEQLSQILLGGGALGSRTNKALRIWSWCSR